MRLLIFILLSVECLAQGLTLRDPVFVASRGGGGGGGGGAPSTLNDNLVAYWKMDEASGARADAQASYDLTDNNTVGSAAGRIGDAGSYIEANTEYLSRDDETALQYYDQDFTFSAWFKTTASGFNFILYSGSFENYGLMLTDSQQISGFVNDGTIRYEAITSGLTLDDDAWHLAVVWYDYGGTTGGGFETPGSTVKVQVDNGTIYSTDVDFQLQVHSLNDFFIGTWGGGNYWEGEIDEVGHWNRVLTADERTELYNAGAGVTCCPFP